MKQSDRHSTKAFTLLELSVVLVVIGLLVGGVLIGKDLIEAARLRGIHSEVERVSTAVQTFKLKYNCLPGDCASSRQFFTAPASCAGSVKPTEACNGNGDGIVGYPGGGWGQSEPFHFWRMSKASQLFDSRITLSSPSIVGWFGVTQTEVGGNVPQSSYSEESFMFIANSYTTDSVQGKAWGNGFWFPFDYTNALVFANYNLGSPQGPLNALQAQSIDTKFDDGFGNGGKIISWYAYGSCVPAASATLVRYAPVGTGSNYTARCGLVYLRLF